MARLESIRLIIAIASYKGWSLHQLDVKSTFLNGWLDEEVYVSQPPGFEVKGQAGKVYKLRKSFYGLKQSPRAWNRRIDCHLIGQKFMKCESEHGVYVKHISVDKLLILCLYVDDLLVTSPNEGDIEEFKQMMKREFEMTDLGRLSHFLGLEFIHTKQGIFMHQRKYATSILERFKMS